MNTYALYSGEIIEYPNQPAVVNAFIARATAALNNPAVTPAEMLSLVYGVENPILDTTSQPGRAIVNKAVFDNPVYRVLSDMVGRKQILASGQTFEQVSAPYTVSVKDAADQLGLTESSVRTAITNRKLSALKRNGDWYIRPESVASYKVSNRGRKKAKTANEGASQQHDVPRVLCGSAPGGSLSVRIAGGELTDVSKEGNVTTGNFPAGWTRAAIRTTSPKGAWVFEIEPDEGSERVEFLDFEVAGPFKVVRKHNATKPAGEVWKGYAEEATV
jgi:hypothetical protein